MGFLDDTRKTSIQAYARTQVDARRAESDDDFTRDIGRDGAAPVPSSGEEHHWESLAPDTVKLPVDGDVVGGNYRLVRLLGQGMFGKVYVAQRVDVPEHQVALKLLPRSMYVGRNVERELVMLATVGHPNVVQLKDHGTTPDYVWLTMPVYRGETLAERLEQGPLDLDEAFAVFLAVARGLEALHSAGLRHQDVKPENIYLARFGGLVQPILLDLGVAAEIDASFVAGTALYASPEQLAVLSGYPGAYPLGDKMDTYCLASTLLRSIVGPDDFPGEKARSRDDLVAAQEERASKPLRPSALPRVVGAPRAKLEEALRRWLAFEPSDRPTMAQMSDELDVLNDPAREVERADRARRASQKRSLSQVRLALGAFVIVAIAGGAYAYSKRELIALGERLRAAEQKGSASFEDLNSCKLSFGLAQDQMTSCRAELDRDRSAFKASLDNVTKTGSEAERVRARELRAVHERLQTVEKRAQEDRRRSDDDARRIAGETRTEHDKLVTEHDKIVAEREKDQRAAEAALASAIAERDKLRADVHRCEEDRDACKAAQATPPPKKPAPATSAEPGPLDRP